MHDLEEDLAAVKEGADNPVNPARLPKKPAVKHAQQLLDGFRQFGLKGVLGLSESGSFLVVPDRPCFGSLSTSRD